MPTEYKLSHTASEIDASLQKLVGVKDNVQKQLDEKSDAKHTHNYAGSSRPGGSAIVAEKLASSAGSDVRPVYFENGVPVETTHTLGASIPSCSSANNGQFLRVVNGEASWEAIPNAEEATF